MTTVMNTISPVLSTIGEAAGVKPDDSVIAQGAILGCKMGAMAYCTALLESATPELRHILRTHLQDELAEHERLTKLAAKKGWYKPDDKPEAILQQALKNAMPGQQ